MNELFRNTLGPTAWTLIALVPPAIFALYFLRLKRQPLEVPSTYLWTKVIEDLHVNSLWQKLRRNLLLLLQLLLVFLAILALLRPGWQGESLDGQQFIFLIDRSASMSTADATASRGVPAPGAGQTRLDAAKQRLAALVDQLESDMSAMIIAFDDRPDVVQEFTNNRRLLREAITRIEPTAKTTNIRGALELAGGFANPTAPASDDEGQPEDVASTSAAAKVELYILSDGRFAAVDGFSLGNLNVKYLPIGSFEAGNLALTALNARRNELRPEQRQAFVQLANFTDAERNSTVSLYLNGKLLDAAHVTSTPGDVAGATFNLGDVPEGRLEARLDAPLDGSDSLALDNRAYAVLDRQSQARVLLITPGNNRALELGLSTERVARLGTVELATPEKIAAPEFQRLLQSETYDLVIFDQCAPEKPEQMPLANTLFIGRRPPLADWRERSSAEPAREPQIIDWQRSHPLLNLVELGNVAVVDSLVVQPPPGGKVLVDSTKGPLLAIAPRDSYEDAVLGFEIVGRDDSGATTVNTNWPRRHSFPNFCLNVVQYLAGGDADLHVHNHRPGETIELKVPLDARGVTVVLPDKSTRQLEPPATGKLPFHETDQLGAYDVQADGQLVGRFAVNLFDRQESDVRLRARQDDSDGVQTVVSLTVGYEDVVAQSPSSPMRKELWTWLLLAALFVLVLEWYIYNRRVYV
jgi:hypothetical protein